MLTSIKRVLLTALTCLCVNLAFAQATFTSTGNWNTPGNWTAGNIGDNISENVTINAGLGAIVQNLDSYIIGDLNFAGTGGLTVNNGGTLEIGQSGMPKNLNASNNISITVAATGALTIWGNVNVGDNLTWNIAGTVTIKGNVILDDGASLSVSGNLVIDGNFIADDNTQFTITGGFVTVNGSVSVGDNSFLIGDPPPPPRFVVNGCCCTEGGGSTFCSSGLLPIELLYFKAIAEGSAVVLTWATESEESFDHFEIDRAAQDLHFLKLGEVQGVGYDTNSERTYSFVDDNPYVGLNYYRLKAVDISGSFEYFNIVYAKVESSQTFEVYPNPITDGTLNYRIDFNPTSSDQVTLVDVQGKAILSDKVATSGVNTIELQNLKPGFYLLKYSSPTFQRIVKVIKH